MPAISAATVVLSDLVDWFYSYFDFTKVWSRRVIAEAVSNAVLASRVGYAVGLIHGEGTTEVRDPKLIRIGEMLPSEEIDMSADAALLEAAYAQRTLDEGRTPSGTPTGDGRPETTISASSELATMDEARKTTGTKSAESSHSGSVDTVGRVELKATVGKAGFFDLNRALSWLRDNARDVHVEISIDAVAGDEGFDPRRTGLASAGAGSPPAAPAPDLGLTFTAARVSGTIPRRCGLRLRGLHASAGQRRSRPGQRGGARRRG